MESNFKRMQRSALRRVSLGQNVKQTLKQGCGSESHEIVTQDTSARLLPRRMQFRQTQKGVARCCGHPCVDWYDCA
jgi:hypothetical protein